MQTPALQISVLVAPEHHLSKAGVMQHWGAFSYVHSHSFRLILYRRNVLYASYAYKVLYQHHQALMKMIRLHLNSLFIGFSSHLRPFGLQFSITFCILLLFILVTCRSQFDLYPLSLPSNGVTFKS
jgi:hypothetical protein